MGAPPPLEERAIPALPLSSKPPSALLDSDAFRRIAGHWLTGVAIVTSRDKLGRPVGLTVNSVAPLSLTPPMFLICLDLGSETLLAIEAHKTFAINFLGRDGGGACASFAKKVGDKFAGVANRVGEFGSPILHVAIAHVECELHEAFVAGDHKVLVGSALAGEVSGGEPLAYFRGELHRLRR